jgi:hypothetical protein
LAGLVASSVIEEIAPLVVPSEKPICWLCPAEIVSIVVPPIQAIPRSASGLNP